MRRVWGWLDERTGWAKLSEQALDEEIRGGARWAYVLGSAVLFVFLLQALTGMFLTMYYVPSSDHAHVSVAYIQKAVPGGSLLRGLHYYGASAFIILIVAHMCQTFLYGAYKQKRELVWVAGGMLFLIALGFGFTGYLLPWDQEAYFGTKVGTSIAGEIPIVGPLQQRVMLGGREISSLTLSRFFMVHVFLLPLLIGLLIVAHIYLFRRAGPAGPFHKRADNRMERFYPKQLLRDVLFVFAVFAILIALAKFLPADLGPQADPTSNYLARPAWYFLPLFEMLKYFPGKLSLIPALLAPVVLFALIFALPFFDRKSERNPLRRPVATTVVVLLVAGACASIFVSKYQDRHNPQFSAELKQQDDDATVFLKSAFVPQANGRSIPVTPPEVPSPSAMESPALKIFLADCANCHGANGSGGTLGPSLINIAKRRNLNFTSLTRWIAGHGRETAADSMPKFRQLTQDERNQIADWLLKLDKPLVLVEATPSQMSPSTPPKSFTTECAVCHGDQAEGAIGPPLQGVTSKPNRTEADLAKILDNSRSYGLKDPMPASFPKLAAGDKAEIVHWLATLR